MIGRKRVESSLKKGVSVIADFDATNPEREKELRALADKYGARLVGILVTVPEEVILERLRMKKYTSHDLFQRAEEAIRVHHKQHAFR